MLLSGRPEIRHVSHNIYHSTSKLWRRNPQENLLVLVVNVQKSTQRKCRITSPNQQRPTQLAVLRVIAASLFTCDHPCLIKRTQRVPPSLSTVQKAVGLHSRAVRSCRDRAASESCVQHTNAHSVKYFHVRVRCTTP